MENKIKFTTWTKLMDEYLKDIHPEREESGVESQVDVLFAMIRELQEAVGVLSQTLEKVGHLEVEEWTPFFRKKDKSDINSHIQAGVEFNGKVKNRHNKE